MSRRQIGGMIGFSIPATILGWITVFKIVGGIVAGVGETICAKIGVYGAKPKNDTKGAENDKGGASDPN